jgi:peptidoglycan/xylan/chitin deacetylase (PgdA/CDA1 family)
VSALRAVVKDGLRNVVATAAPPLWGLSAQSRLLILMYHRVLPLKDPARQFEQPGMIVAPETLEMHIRVLRRRFQLVHLDDWMRDSANGLGLPRLACALTFDDGWRDNYTQAFPVLKAAGAPATIYLVSNLVGGNYGFWPTRLARMLCHAWALGDERAPSRLAQLCPKVAVPARSKPDAAIVAADSVLRNLKREYSDASMLEVLAELQVVSGEAGERELLSWREVQEMAASGLVRFGSHTCTHTRLGSGVDSSLAEQEINESARDIEANLGLPVTGFCYPNGDYTPEVIEMVRGRYSCAVTTRFGWNTAASNRLLLRRVAMHDDVSNTPSRLFARIALGL